MNVIRPQDHASLDISTGDGGLTLTITGRLNADNTAEIWERALAAVDQAQAVVIDLSGLDYCDGVGVGLLVEARRRQAARGRTAEIRGANEGVRSLLGLYPLEKFTTPELKQPRPGTVETIGRAAVQVLEDIRDVVTFVGELMYEGAGILRHPLSLRWRDTMATVERAGVDAVPIVMLLGFLFGLVLAFQSLLPLRQFGAELYVADLLAISLTRELGPLLAVIILISRSSSSFAAELGTMKVNEEINALQTMGISPLRFLVLPRVLAGTFVSPLLAVLCTAVGLFGGAIVVMVAGYPLVTYADRVVIAAKYGDLLGGLFKAMVFGMCVSAIGCMRGLSTGVGSSAVGLSTTRAVVTSLVLLIVADGVFAFLFFALGI